MPSTPHRLPMTIRDVSGKAGVSPATVSRVFNAPQTVRPLLRERVQAAARELGYRPNRVRSLRTPTHARARRGAADAAEPGVRRMPAGHRTGGDGRRLFDRADHHRLRTRAREHALGEPAGARCRRADPVCGQRCALGGVEAPARSTGARTRGLQPPCAPPLRLGRRPCRGGHASLAPAHTRPPAHPDGQRRAGPVGPRAAAPPGLPAGHAPGRARPAAARSAVPGRRRRAHRGTPGGLPPHAAHAHRTGVFTCWPSAACAPRGRSACACRRTCRSPASTASRSART